jgi:hypothetical protein
MYHTLPGKKDYDTRRFEPLLQRSLGKFAKGILGIDPEVSEDSDAPTETCYKAHWLWLHDVK